MEFVSLSDEATASNKNQIKMERKYSLDRINFYIAVVFAVIVFAVIHRTASVFLILVLVVAIDSVIRWILKTTKDEKGRI